MNKRFICVVAKHDNQRVYIDASEIVMVTNTIEGLTQLIFKNRDNPLGIKGSPEAVLRLLGE